MGAIVARAAQWDVHTAISHGSSVVVDAGCDQEIDGVGKVGCRETFPIDMNFCRVIQTHVETITVNIGPAHRRPLFVRRNILDGMPMKTMACRTIDICEWLAV